jgi:hypothetical protein
LLSLRDPHRKVKKVLKVLVFLGGVCLSVYLTESRFESLDLKIAALLSMEKRGTSPPAD